LARPNAFVRNCLAVSGIVRIRPDAWVTFERQDALSRVGTRRALPLGMMKHRPLRPLSALLFLVAATGCATAPSVGRPRLPETITEAEVESLYAENRISCRNDECLRADGRPAPMSSDFQKPYSQTEQVQSNAHFIRNSIGGTGAALGAAAALWADYYWNDSERIHGTAKEDERNGLIFAVSGLGVLAVSAVAMILWPEPNIEEPYNKALKLDLEQRYQASAAQAEREKRAALPKVTSPISLGAQAH
jgi:hypothetical protein